jgi:hypothetical protein
MRPVVGAGGEPEVGDAVEFARVRLGFEADAKQAVVLRSEAKRGILNCSRQWGKSTVAAAKAVYRTYTRPKSLVLVASPTERQSGEFLKKTEGMLEMLRIPARGDGHNALSLVLPNGSRIVGLPGTGATVRGFSAVSLLVIEEAAYAGGGWRGFVDDEYSAREAGVFLRNLDPGGAGVGEGAGAGDGMRANSVCVFG